MCGGSAAPMKVCEMVCQQCSVLTCEYSLKICTLDE